MPKPVIGCGPVGGAGGAGGAAGVVGVVDAKARGSGGRGAARPANQSRAGGSHNSRAQATTIEERKPPVTMPLNSRGRASTVSPMRAVLLRRSTW